MYKMVVVTAALLAAPLTAFAQTSGNAAHGKSLFATDGCAECHGTSAEGGTGPHLAPNPPPAAFIASYVRSPKGQMPPYAAGVLSDSDIADIHAYLRSVPTPPKPGTLAELGP
jgi:mono/diheme cytochrome c family protein